MSTLKRPSIEDVGGGVGEREDLLRVGSVDEREGEERRGEERRGEEGVREGGLC